MTSRLSGGVHTLLIDDDERLLDVASQQLTRHSDRITTVTATSASTALDELSAAEFDCVVTDYNMPGMTGLELLEEIRAHDPDLPVIFLTGEGTESVASDAISNGVTDYLQKSGDPTVFQILARRIERYVDQTRSEEAVRRSNERIRQVYERVTDAVVALDDDLAVTFLDSTASDLLGRATDDLQGQCLSDVYPGLDETDFEPELRHALESGEPAGFEEYFEPLDAWLAVTAYPGSDGITLFIRDVTETKEREAEIQQLRRELDMTESKFETLRDRISRPSPPFR